MSNKNVSNKKVNIKGLLLFFFGFSVASISTIMVLLFFVPTKSQKTTETQTIAPEKTLIVSEKSEQKNTDIVSKEEKPVEKEASEEVKEPGAEVSKTPEKIPSATKKSKKSAEKKSQKTVKRSSKNIKNEAEVIVSGPAFLDISADMEAVIFVDGKKIRNAPLSRYSVSPGSHNVVIIPASDPTSRKKFTLEAESGVRYMRNWSFTNKTWILKKP